MVGKSLRVPIGAEARGKRRLLRQQLAASADRLLTAARSARARTLVEAWVHKRGNGRMRAQAHLLKLFGPCPRIVERSYMGWLFLKPGGRVITDDDRNDPGLVQDSIACCVLLAGLLPGRASPSITKCIWNLEFSDHAIGRLLERSPRADPVAVMIAAHDALMNTGLRDSLCAEIWVPGGDSGAFACRPIAGEVADLPGKAILHVRARTWLDADQLIGQRLVGQVPPSERLGGSFGMPALTIPPAFSDLLLAHST